MIREPQKSQGNSKPSSAEALIRYNGELIEKLFSSEAWTEIVFPILSEMIASVSGRFSNGRFRKGSITKDTTRLLWMSGYQSALEEFHNALDDFIVAKETLKRKKEEEEASKDKPYYNPFLEELKDVQDQEDSQEY